MTVKEFLTFAHLSKTDILADKSKIEVWLEDDEHIIFLSEDNKPYIKVFNLNDEYIGRLDFDTIQEFIDKVEVESFAFDNIHDKLIIFVDICVDEIIHGNEEEEGWD